MNTHVFIVDIGTFKYHLEYLFAGTGARENIIDFNNKTNSTLHSTTENMLVGMITDANRIRENDNIIFYLQQNFSKKILEKNPQNFKKIIQSFKNFNSKNNCLKLKYVEFKISTNSIIFSEVSY